MTHSVNFFSPGTPPRPCLISRTHRRRKRMYRKREMLHIFFKSMDYLLHFISSADQLVYHPSSFLHLVLELIPIVIN